MDLTRPNILFEADAETVRRGLCSNNRGRRRATYTFSIQGRMMNRGCISFGDSTT